MQPMNPATLREARLAFTQAIDKLIEHEAPVTPEAMKVLEMWWMSGVQWGLDHSFLERKSRIITRN